MISIAFDIDIQYQNLSGVYGIRNNLDSKVYIGSAKFLFKRYNQHKSELENGSHCNQKLLRAVLKYGIHNFSFILVELCDVDALLATEQKWINNLKAVSNGYNICVEAGSRRGTPITEDHKKNISESKRGKPRSAECKERIAAALRGKKLTDEHKKKIAFNNKGATGYVHTEEARLALSIANKGKKLSELTKQKMSLARKGKGKAAEHIEKLRLANIGKKRSEQTRINNSNAQKGKKLSAEHIEKIASKNRGRKFSPEVRLKYSAAAKTREAQKRNR